MGIESIDDLHFAWYHRIITLITEYFYNDGERMRAVLGKFFVGSLTVDPVVTNQMSEMFDDGEKFEICTLEDDEFIEVLRNF